MSSFACFGANCFDKELHTNDVAIFCFFGNGMNFSKRAQEKFRSVYYATVCGCL